MIESILCLRRYNDRVKAQHSLLVAIIVALVAILQIVRAVRGLPVTIGQASIPIWASWVACAVAIVLRGHSRHINLARTA